jgi:hypothetical protein
MLCHSIGGSPRRSPSHHYNFAIISALRKKQIASTRLFIDQNGRIGTRRR